MADDKNSTACFEEIKAYSENHLKRFVERGLSHAEKCCTELLNDPDIESEEKDDIYKAQEFLTAEKLNLTATFIENFGPALLGDRDLEAAGKNPTISLALVDDDTLDEMIIIGELCGKIQDHYDLQLKAIKRGLVRLSKKMDIEPEPEALTPKKLVQLLHAPLNESELNLASKKYIYKPFADAAQVELKLLYDGILALLQESAIITPEENPASANYKIIFQYRQSQSTGGTSAPTDPEMAIPAAPPTGGMPVVAPTYTQAASIPNVPNMPSYGMPQIAPANLAPVAATAMNPATFQSSETSQAVYGFLNRSTPAQTDASGAPLPTVESTELLKLLSSLQNLNTLELARSALQNSASIGEHVNEAIASKTSEWSKQLSGPESNVIELVNNMFITVFEDSNLIDPVKVQIGRLQIPYIKVALLDITLLDQAAHPARLLLNELASIGVRVDGSDDPLMELIATVIRNILDGFETDLNVFTSSLQQLREANTSQESEALAAEEETREQAESQAKILHIKKHIISRLRQHLKGKVLPKEVHGLLLKGFAPLLLKIYRKEGEDSESWKNTIFLLRQVVESVQPRDSAYQLEAVLERSEVIIKDAQSAIQLLPKKLVDDKLVEGLKAIYANLAERQEALKAEQAEEPEENRIDPLALDPDEEPELDLEFLSQPSTEELLSRLPEQVQAGAWCEVYMGRNESARRLKISTILEETAQIVFVDSTGVKSEIKDVQDFLDELDCERSRLLPGEQLFDKALSAVINNMNLMRAAT